MKRADLFAYSDEEPVCPHVLEFQAIAWSSGDEDDVDGEEEDEEDDDDEEEEARHGGDGDNLAFVVRVFGVTAEGRSVALAIRAFTPYFYIKVAPHWTPGQTRALKEFITSHKKLGVLLVRSVSKKDFYGFRNGKTDTFLRIDCRSLKASKIMAYKLQKPVQGRGIAFPAGEISLYESNIEPIIRFMHMRDIQPAGWLAVSRKDLAPSLESRCSMSFGTSWNKVTALNQRHDSAPFLLASFDIECNSSHGDFPTPKKDYSKLAMELKAAFVSLNANTSEYAVKGFLRRCLEHAFVGGGCGDIQGISRVHLRDPAAKLPAKLPLIIDDLYAGLVGKKSVPADPLKVLNDALPRVEGDAIIQIGVTFGIYGRPLVSTKDARHIFVLGGCTEVPGATVHVCSSERDLIVKWAAFVGAMDPDLLMGYNIIGFDMEYIKERAEELSCKTDLLRLTSRLRYVASLYREINLSSSALGDNFLRIIDMPGRVIMDLMKVVQRDHKLDSYKLDAVAEHFTGNKKNDVSPADIFRLQRGSDADRSIIAAYCVQDCELVLQLAWRLCLMANNIGMANVCTVPLSYIFMRGQGVKIFSLVAKQCKLDNFVVPTAARFSADVEDDGYEGAIVLEPHAGIYLEPVSVLDYASLYPSSMISENLSHDSIVMDPQYGSVPGVTYVDIAYDIYEGTGSSKVKVNTRTCRFAQGADGGKAVIPRILQDLIAQRKATRKTADHKRVTLEGGRIVVGPLSGSRITDAATGEVLDVTTADATSIEDAYTDFHKAVLDGLQAAYKVTANSLYGALGARSNPLYLKDLAACTTATGRSLILQAKAFVQKEFGARVIYGDSVAGYTPVLLRRGGTAVVYETIERMVGTGRWTPCLSEPGREGKDACELHGVEAWTEAGWTPVHRVIRHALAKGKAMVRVMTSMGVVDVTDDHSLLRPDGEPVTPRSLGVDDRLLHAPHPAWTSAGTTNISVQEACIMGMFMGCRCNLDETAKGFIYSYAMRTIQAYAELCADAYPNLDWQISGPDADGLHILSPNAPPFAEGPLGDLLDRFSSRLISCGSFVVPTVILASSSFRVKRAFLDGLQTSNPSYTAHSQLTAATLFALLDSLDLHGRVSVTRAGYQFTEQGILHEASTSAQVAALDYSAIEYVYDLTTGNNHFAAGIGKLIVHNTDSIFCIFKNEDQGAKLQGKAALRKSIQTGIAASAAFKVHLKPPHDLEYEKTFYPFIILSKKRYVGNLYEHDVDSFKQKSMGIVLKRRDNANIVKLIYGGIIDIILNRQGVPASVAFLRAQLTSLVDGASPLHDLVITKSLRANYKDPEKIAHQVLAKRMGDRDAGSRPQTNERIPFVYIVNTTKGVLQGDRIEHPSYVKDNGLQVDYRFYIEHQIMKPVIQLYAIVLEQLAGYNKPANYWVAKEKELRKTYGGDVAKAREKVAALREQEAQKLLFDRVLIDLDTENKGQNKITKFFARTSQT